MSGLERTNPQRYQSPEWQAWWEDWIKSELNYFVGELSFFEDFSKRHWHDYELHKTIQNILKEVLTQKIAYLREALKLGDYPDASSKLSKSV